MKISDNSLFYKTPPILPIPPFLGEAFRRKNLTIFSYSILYQHLWRAASIYSRNQGWIMDLKYQIFFVQKR